MSDDAALRRPIGWWLKEADARLDAAFDRALVDHQVDRRGWQVLATLARGPSSRAELTASLASFDSAEVVEHVIDDLGGRGWVEESSGRLRLTAEGERQQAVLQPLVDDVRQQVAAALPPDDYVQLVRLLDRLVAGLS